MPPRHGSERKTTISIVAAMVLTVAVDSGCSGDNRADGRKPLPPPSPDAKPGDYEPRLPFKELGPNVLARTMYSDNADTEYAVEARELAVPPGKTVSDLKLPGAAIFQLREGSAVARIGDRTQLIGAGAAFVAAEGASVTLENKGETPLFLRVHVVKAK